MKKLAGLMLVLVTGVVLCNPAFAAFENYADIDSTLILPPPVSEEAEIANVVGTVFCQETNKPIANAILTVETAIDKTVVASVTTDHVGRFQILGLAGGFYNWIVESDEYYTAEYTAYDICDGITSIFTLYMSDKEAISRESSHSWEMALLEESKDLSIEETEQKAFSFSKFLICLLSLLVLGRILLEMAEQPKV